MSILLDGAGAVIELVGFGFALGEVLPMALGEAAYWSVLVHEQTTAEGA